MREIKFRTPHYTINGKFVKFSYWGKLEKGVFASPSMVNKGPIKKPDEQYTGLKDKNGKEIYEGDKWQRDSFIGVISFEFSGWHIVTDEKSPIISYPSFYSNASLGEVIGNIHK